MGPYMSWAAVALVGAGAAYYYTQSGQKRRGRSLHRSAVSDQASTRSPESQHEGRDTRKKKGKNKTPGALKQTANDTTEVASTPQQPGPAGRLKKRKGDKTPSSKLAQSSAVDVDNKRHVDPDEDDQEDGMSNAEFAKQLSGLKTGTSLKKVENTKENQKTRKQGKSRELPQDATNGSAVKPTSFANGLDMSTASSTTGAEADDDISIPVSPETSATDVPNASGVDVSDMLEAPAKGPSILRLVEPVNPKPVKQPREKKAAAEQETKKQRQNRQKNEEKKALREQAEKERRVLLEKQLRTAREAEGRPAKNGLGTSNAPSKSVWQKPNSNERESSAPEPPRASNGPLLDTFDDDTPQSGPNSTAVNGDVNDQSTNHSAGEKHLPSEEEQLRLLEEMNSESHWNTVAKGGKGRKKKTNGVSAQEGENQLGTNETPSVTTDYSSNNEMSYAESETVSNDEKAVNSEPKPGQTHSHPENTSSVVQDKKPEFITNENNTNGTQLLDEIHGPSESAQKSIPSNNAKTDIQPTPPKRPKATFKTIDHDVWNRDNIREHPDFDPAWPYALTGHPMDSDWAADWDSDDMKKNNKKGQKQASMTEIR